MVHIDQKPWDGTKTVLEPEALKTMRESKKFSYLERIEMEQKVRPVPCISTYRLEKSVEEKV